MRDFGRSSILVLFAAGAVTASAQSSPAPQTPAAPRPEANQVTALAPASTQADTATKILADARNALGGESKQAAVKTIVATGRTRRVSGENLIPVEFEIAIELPDKYVRKDEIPAQETEPSSSGFNGDNLIQIPPPPPMPAQPAGAAAGVAVAGRAVGPPPGAAVGAPARGRPAGPPLTPQQQQEAQRRTRVTTLKQDFARLTLGMFAMSFGSYPLTFSYGGQAEAPQGKADVVDVKGPANFSARLFVMSDTHLPVMVSWTTPVTPANIVITTPGQAKPATSQPGAIVVEGPAPPPAGASKEDRDAYAREVAALRQKTMAGAKPIENRLYYSDYRDNDGLQFPFRLRRAIGSDTVEETTFDRFRINAKIDPKRFESVK